MRTSPAIIKPLLISAILALVYALPASAEIEFALTDLGTLGGDYSSPTALNNRGQVIGVSSTVSGDTHAFVWQDGVLADLGALPGGSGYSIAMAINDKGQIAGTSGVFGVNLFNISHLVLWKDLIMTDLGMLDGLNTSPVDINEAGQIVGDYYDSMPSNNFEGSFVWQRGRFTGLGNIGGGITRAIKINDIGQVIGTSYDRHSFIWQKGVLKMLGENASVYDINEAGQAVGHDSTDFWGQAFIWQNGILKDLGSLGRGGSSAYSVNDRGQVVGYLIDTFEVLYPFIWQDSAMAELETLGGWYALATSVNNFGQALGGTFYDRLSDQHPCIWVDGVITDLKVIGLDSVTDINDLGQVIGTSNNHAFLCNTRKIVGVAINPDDGSGTINLKGGDTVSVAVLGSAAFDATMVDPSTVSLSGASVMPNENGKPLYKDLDINGDGFLDRVFKVSANQLLLTRYDTVAVLQAKTYDDTPISGWGYVKVR